MKLPFKKSAWLALAFGMAGGGFAQNRALSPDGRTNHFASSRQEVEAYAATNKTFAPAIEYFIATMDGNQPAQLPDGVTEDDVSRAVLKVFPKAEIMFDRPINFYAKVVDENNQPVSGAIFHFELQGYLVRGHVAREVVSDQAGFVSLTNQTGTQLDVSVHAPGYYPSRRNGGAGSFHYAVTYGDAFKSDPNQPVLYYFQKKGIGANTLITSQSGMSDGYSVKAPLDGTTVKVNLLERKTGDGPLEISQVKPIYANWKTTKEWSFTMKIPDGGFIEENEEFPFHPPASGYQPLVEFKFENWQTNWTTDTQKEYYVKFGNPPVYGRLHLETSISSDSARLRYTINPDGSRNLEPK